MPLKIGINHCSNSEYHADREFISSSGLKLVLKNPAEFNQVYNLGVKTENSASKQAAFDEGSLTHTLILEPELKNTEFAFYPGMIKRNNQADLELGFNFEQFKSENAGKTIISKPQEVRVSNLIEAYKKRAEAVSLISGGHAEHTIAGELRGVKVKARADYINIDKGYIADVKTTGLEADLESFKMVCKDFGYFLSASLYTSMFSEHYQKPFDFYFIVLSKLTNQCEVYKLSEYSLNKGKDELYKAISILNLCRATDTWEPLMKRFKPEQSSNYIIKEV